MRTLFAALPIAMACPAAAQMHDMRGMQMPGMTMPAKTAAPKKAAPRRPVTARPAKPAVSRKPDMPAAAAADPCPPAHAAMGHCTAAAVAGEPTIAQAPAARAGTDQIAGDSAAPAPPTTRAGDAFYPPAAMAAADRAMRAEHGGTTFSQVIFNIAEVQVKRGRDGYRWDGEAWLGGDIHRVVVKSEGEGSFGDRAHGAEAQALYSKTLDPYWNLQAGVRQDLGAGAKQTYATLGVEGLAPYWLDVEAALFVSDRGDILARGEAWADQRITQRLILQPRVEINLAAQDVPASRIGAGLSSAEAGLRLRYEIARAFAPYVGVSWERRYAATARFARTDGRDGGDVALAVGVRGWF